MVTARPPPDLAAQEWVRQTEHPLGRVPAAGADRLSAREPGEQAEAPAQGRVGHLEQAVARGRRASAQATGEDRAGGREPDRAAWGLDPSPAAPEPKLRLFISDPIRWQSAPNRRILPRLM